MKKYLVSFLMMQLFSSSMFSNDPKDIFIQNVLEMKYSKAIAIAENIVDSETKLHCTVLANTLYSAGQNPLESSAIEQLNVKTDVFGLLAKGYHILFTDPYSSEPFDYFNQAYRLAVDLEYDNLKKLCLVAILEVYSYEVAQSNDDYLIYLKRFKELSSNSVDLFHYHINYLLHNLRKVDYSGNLDIDFFEAFEKLMSNFKYSHPFWVVYSSTVAVSWEMRDKQKAKGFYNNALRNIGEEPFLKRLKFRCHIRLSEMNRREGSYQMALAHIDSARSYYNKADSIRSSYYLSWYASNNYYGLGNYRKAYLEAKSSDSLKNLLDYEKNSLEISRLNAKYQTAEKEKRILEEEQRAKTNRNWLIAAGLTLLIGSSIAILVHKNTTNKRRLAEQESLLKQQRVDNLLKEQELVSIDAMIEGQEKERQKVADELHDDLGSLMATIKLHFDKVKIEENDSALQNAQRLLEEAYQKIRGMAHSKNSGVMSDQGLLSAIKKMAQIISETDALQVTVEDFGMGERMENSLELTLFRVVQELVANAIKHASAKQVHIQLTQYEDNLNIIVEDDGRGFNIEKVNQSRAGMGLNSIEKRIEHLEGNFTVDSVLGRGTSILIDIPV